MRFSRRLRKVIRWLPALSLREAFQRPGASAFDDPNTWELVTSWELAVRLEVERSKRGFRGMARNGAARVQARCRIEAEARV